MKYSILIPAYKPDESLIQTVDSLTDTLKDLLGANYEIVIVNDGSPEECGSVFAALDGKVTLLTHTENRGKGAALKTGMEYIQRYCSPSVVVTADADGQHLPVDILNCIISAESDQEALVLGTRKFRLGSGVPIKSFLGNKITEGVFLLSTGKHLHDTQTGLRAFHSSLIPELMEAEGDRYEYEMNQLLKVIKDGVPIREVPIATVYKGKNESSHFDPFRDSFLIYRKLLKFALSSVSSFIVDYIMFAFFSLLFTGTAGVALSNVFARVISAGFNYEINRDLVFRDNGARSSSLPKYAALAAVVLILNTGILYMLNLGLGIPLLLAKIITEAVVFLFSWSMQNIFVFTKGGAFR